MKNIKKLFHKKNQNNSQNSVRNWKDIHEDFDKHSIYQSWWENQSFNYDQAKEWISAGLEPREAHFAFYLRQKGCQASLLSSSIEELRKEYCRAENRNNWGFQRDFDTCTSENLIINEFIQKQQLEASDANEFLEWIPYEKFSDIKYLAEGGFGKVYKTKLNNKLIALKSLNNSSNIQENFLKEITNHKLLSDKSRETSNHKLSMAWKPSQKLKPLPKKSFPKRKRFFGAKSSRANMYMNSPIPSTIDLTETSGNFVYGGLILECYGISQDPKTKNYLIVMRYVGGGNLRQFSQNHLNSLSLKEKLYQLHLIAKGLNSIHEKNLIHRDFHPGNILCDEILYSEHIHIHITDLGLCRPVDERDSEKIYGVMPYISPEVLRGRPCTQKADIYSFGIIAYEVLTEMEPYLDSKYDTQLALAIICQEKRPEFKIKMPQLLEDLIQKCWDANPVKRPTAKELSNLLEDWSKSVDIKLLGSVIKTNKPALADPKKFTSKLLPTEKINEQISKIIEFDTRELDEALEKIQEEENWKNIHLSFASELIQTWQNLSFTCPQVQEWANAFGSSFNPQEYEFINWLKSTKNLTPEKVLNYHNLEELKVEYQQSQTQANIIQPTYDSK